jgi:hypothetical protein
MKTPRKPSRGPVAAMREVVMATLTLQAAVIVFFAPAIILRPASDLRIVAGIVLMFGVPIWCGGLIVLRLLGIIFLVRGLVRAVRCAAAPGPKRPASLGVWDREIDGQGAPMMKPSLRLAVLRAGLPPSEFDSGPVGRGRGAGVEGACGEMHPL